MRGRVTGALMAAGVLCALAGCGTSAKGGSGTPASTTSSAAAATTATTDATTTDATTSASPSTTAATTSTSAPATSSSASSSKLTVVTIGKTIYAKPYGDKLTVLKAARNVGRTSYGDEIIALDLKLTVGSKYTGGTDIDSLGIHVGSGTDVISASFDDNAALKKAHLTPLAPEEAPDAGKTESGWVAFNLDIAGAPKLTLVLNLPKAKILGSNKTIPAVHETIALFS